MVKHDDTELVKMLDGYYTVKTSAENHNDKLEWCFFNCSGRFRDKTVSVLTNCWYFEKEEDAIMFVLKWSSNG